MHRPFRPCAALTVVNAKRADDEQDEAVPRSRSKRVGDRDDRRYRSVPPGRQGEVAWIIGNSSHSSKNVAG